MAQNRGRRCARHAQRCLRSCGRFWPGAQTIIAALSQNSLGPHQARAIQSAAGHFASLAEARGSGLGNFSNYSSGIRARLLCDEELDDLIAAAGGKWIFIGMEFIDPANLADVKKGFNKPGEYDEVLDRLARRNVFAITSFIFGMDNDTTGVAERTLKEIRTWPPGLPIFGLMTPLPATPLSNRLAAAGRA